MLATKMTWYICEVHPHDGIDDMNGHRDEMEWDLWREHTHQGIVDMNDHDDEMAWHLRNEYNHHSNGDHDEMMIQHLHKARRRDGMVHMNACNYEQALEYLHKQACSHPFCWAMPMSYVVRIWILSW